MLDAQTYLLEDETPAPVANSSWRGCLAPYRSSLKVRKEAFSHGSPVLAYRTGKVRALRSGAACSRNAL